MTHQCQVKMNLLKYYIKLKCIIFKIRNILKEKTKINAKHENIKNLLI